MPFSDLFRSYICVLYYDINSLYMLVRANAALYVLCRAVSCCVVLCRAVSCCVLVVFITILLCMIYMHCIAVFVIDN